MSSAARSRRPSLRLRAARVAAHGLSRCRRDDRRAAARLHRRLLADQLDRLRAQRDAGDRARFRARIRWPAQSRTVGVLRHRRLCLDAADHAARHSVLDRVRRRASHSPALAGIVLSLFAMRLRGHYLAIASLGFAVITYQILLNWISLTQGPLGIYAIPPPPALALPGLPDDRLPRPRQPVLPRRRHLRC